MNLHLNQTAPSKSPDTETIGHELGITPPKVENREALLALIKSKRPYEIRNRMPSPDQIVTTYRIVTSPKPIGSVTLEGKGVTEQQTRLMLATLGDQDSIRLLGGRPPTARSVIGRNGVIALLRASISDHTPYETRQKMEHREFAITSIHDEDGQLVGTITLEDQTKGRAITLMMRSLLGDVGANEEFKTLLGGGV